jgi:hypothetical protein
VQGPTGFNLVINRKVADALGLTISPQLYIFANEMIEYRIAELPLRVKG